MKVLIVTNNSRLKHEITWLINNSFDCVEIFKAHQGLDAYSVALTQVPDVIIIDEAIAMLSGIQLVRLLRKTPATTKARIFLIGNKAYDETSSLDFTIIPKEEINEELKIIWQ